MTFTKFSLLAIPKICLTETELEDFKDSLSYPDPKYVEMGLENMPKLESFLEDDEYLFVPRNFKKAYSFAKAKSIPIETAYSFDKVSFSMNEGFELRDYQKDYLTPELIQSPDKIINMPCGTGKTLCSLYLSSLYGYRTFVIAPTRKLCKQWRKQIKDNTNASVSFLYENKETDFVIATYEMTYRRDYSPDFYLKFGHFIIDESHRTTYRYEALLLKFSPIHLTALSATFRRSDSFHLILEQHFGKIFTMKNPFPKANFYAVKTEISLRYVNPYAKFITNLSQHKRRNFLIYQMLIRLKRADRKVLVLSHRKEQLKHFHNLFLRDSDLVISENNNLTITKNIVFGIYQMVNEGLDLPYIDTLLILTPMGDVEQAIGRIVRLFPNKKYASAYYLLDNNKISSGQLKKAIDTSENNAVYMGEYAYTKFEKII